MIRKLIRDETGAALLEFTVTLPLFLFTMFGLVQAGLLMFTQAGLQHGVEMAARCASVNYSASQLNLTQSCFAVAPNAVTNSTIQQYAEQNSWGIIPSSGSFTVLTPAANAKCGPNPTDPPGFVVSVSHPFNLINIFPSVTLTAKSCFPVNIS